MLLLDIREDLHYEHSLQCLLTGSKRAFIPKKSRGSVKKEAATPVRKEIAVHAPPPAEFRICPGRDASSAVPAPEAFEKAATLSSKRRLCSSALLYHRSVVFKTLFFSYGFRNSQTCTVAKFPACAD